MRCIATSARRRQHRVHHLVRAPRLIADTASAGCCRASSATPTPRPFAVGAPGVHEEALRFGLVNRLCAPDKLREQTYAYARDLADNVSPSAMAVIKRQLYDVPFQTMAEATIDANREMVRALESADFREGVASFMEKRPPRFTGR